MVHQRIVLIALMASVGGYFYHVEAGMPTELEVETLREGRPCENPTKTGDSIYVHYDGKLHPDLGGDVIENTKGKKPYKFQIGSGREIRGWDLGLLDMCPGAHRRITIPPSYGFDAGTKKGVPVGATLVYDIELVHIDVANWASSWALLQIIAVAGIGITIWVTILRGTTDGHDEPRGPAAAYKRL